MTATVRTIVRLDATDDRWASRSPDNQLAMIARETGRRLKGMSDLLYGVAMLSGASGQEQFSFLGAALSDLSMELERACKAAQDYREAQDARPKRR